MWVMISNMFLDVPCSLWTFSSCRLGKLAVDPGSAGCCDAHVHKEVRMRVAVTRAVRAYSLDGSSWQVGNADYHLLMYLYEGWDLSS